MTINAQYQINSYILSFDAQGGTAIPNQTVVYATKATKPTNPTKTGYNFDAWYQDSNLTILWNFANDTMPAHDVTLYAKWIPIIYTINYFGLEDGTHNNPATFTIEDLPVALENANRIGYTFTGWFDHTTEGNQLENITTIGNLSLYARWQINSYTLNFESNGGTSLESISVTFKDKIIQPADPINTGNTLVGWFKDAGFTQERKFASDTMPANDITLYAQWKYGTHPKCFDFTSSTKTITNYKKDAYPECGPVVAIPDTINNYNVENIGSNALQGKTIHTLTLSGTLKIIGNHAFANNDLTTLRIPNSVTNI